MPVSDHRAGVHEDKVYRPPSDAEPEIRLEDVLERIRTAFPRLGRLGGGGGFSILVIVILAVALVIWLASGIYTVSPDEQAALRTFGKFTGLTEQGLHWYWPAPIGTRNVESVTVTRRLETGFRSGAGGISAVQPFPLEAQMITGDTNIVDVHAVVQYRISDLRNYLFNVADPGELDRTIDPGRPDGRTLRDVTETALRQVVGSRAIDDVLTVEKEIVQEEVLLKMREILDEYKAGISVQKVLLQNVNPPEEVRDAFEDVVRAKEDKEKLINQAEAYRADQIPKAKGEAQKIIEAAEGFKQGRIAKAQGEADGFKALLEGYQGSPNVTRQRLYLEAMEEILPGIQKYIVSQGGVLPLLDLQPQVGPTSEGGGQ